MPSLVWLLACAAQGQELPSMTSRGKPGILRVIAEPLSVPRFGKLELTADLSASYDNPFDPEQVDLTAEFTAPSGRKVTVPGFFYQAYENRNEGDDSKRPMLDAKGEPCRKVRFAPTEVGEHAYVVRLRNRFEGQDATDTSSPGRFACVESKSPGFIRISAKNGRYFQFDDGSAFFPVGHNLQNDWPVYRHSRLLGEASPEIAAWHKEMADYLRGLDPNRHLITTSTWQWVSERFADVWNLDGMDFTQSHIYSPLPAMAPRIGQHLARWSKPHVVGEGGGLPSNAPPEDPHKPGNVDPQGMDFHNSLWVPVMLGSAGTTLPWWWRGRIEPGNLFFHYRAVANFVRDVPWTDAPLRPAQVKSVSLAAKGKGDAFSPVLIVPLSGGWAHKTARDRFVVAPDGTMADVEHFGTNLFGRYRKDWRNPPTFQVTFPAPGRFIVNVVETSHGILEVHLDGNRVLREESLNVARSYVHKDFSVAVPAGVHEITLDNAGGDWIHVGHLILTHYRDARRYPDVDVSGLQSDELALLWIHNRLNEWSYKAAGFDPRPVGPAVVALSGLRDGRYRVEWWDTYKGVVTQTQDATARGGVVELHVPPVQTDIACKITRL